MTMMTGIIVEDNMHLGIQELLVIAFLLIPVVLIIALVIYLRSSNRKHRNRNIERK